MIPFANPWSPWADIWLRSGWRVSVHVTQGTHLLTDPNGRLRRQGSAADCLAEARGLAPSAGRTQALILLHPLARTPVCMKKMEQAALAAGYATANIAYPSTRAPIAAHAARVAAVAEALHEDGATVIHLVGVSLGGLVARAALGAGLPGAGRLVTLGSPHQGSSLARFLSRLPLFRRVFGVCGEEVFTLAPHLPPPPVPTGIITGGNGGRGYNPLLRGDNDGIVTVVEARLPGLETDFLKIPTLHRFLPDHPAALKATLAFLGNGGF